LQHPGQAAQPVGGVVVDDDGVDPGPAKAVMFVKPGTCTMVDRAMLVW
jgi:hypothetical protein